MKKNIICTILLMVTISWMGLIFFLSSQNGEQTAKTSGSIAKATADVIYQKPTVDNIHTIHMDIRLYAHIALFIILGMLVYVTCKAFFPKLKKDWILFVCGNVIVSGFAYYDEWHKQFISGRHFQMNEAALNAVSGLFGILTVMLVIWIYKKRQKFLKIM